MGGVEKYLFVSLARELETATVRGCRCSGAILGVMMLILVDTARCSDRMSTASIAGGCKTEPPLNPFRAPKSLPVLSSSNFIPQRVFNSKGVKDGWISVMVPSEIGPHHDVMYKVYCCAVLLPEIGSTEAPDIPFDV